jgi:hypothetical protein
MKISIRILPAVVLVLASLTSALPAHAQAPAAVSPATSKDSTMHHAKGTFDPKIEPAAADEKVKDAGIARLTIDKQYHGDLDAHSVGVMLATGSAKGSGGYVAIERVTGTLDGRSGSFALQHSGTMDNGSPTLIVTVIPGSGTGGMQGISGKMQIIIADGKHSYDFEYSLPPGS